MGNHFQKIAKKVSAKNEKSLVSALSEVIKRREVNRLVYCHADHFEPWHFPFCEAQLDQVLQFREMTEKLPFARKQTLFYSAYLDFALKEDLKSKSSNEIYALDDDQVAFFRAPKDVQDKMRNTIRELAATSTHEFQVHIHHESWTKSECRDFENQRKIQDWLAAHSSVELDEQRFELHLEKFLELFSHETGAKLDKWAFVHGNWALNGSDLRICSLRNEIQTLMKYGCVADFTFPAPRKVVNPRCKEPFTIRPTNELRCYDLDSSDPRLLHDHADDLDDPERLLIWSAGTNATDLSLDFYGQSARNKLSFIDGSFVDALMTAPVYNKTLYLKTHAHSLNEKNFESLYIPVLPHSHPEVQRVFSCLIEASQLCGFEIEYLTVSELLDDLKTQARQPSTSNDQETQKLGSSLSHVLITNSMRKLPLSIELDNVTRSRAIKGDAIARPYKELFSYLGRTEVDTQWLEVGRFPIFSLLSAMKGGPSMESYSWGPGQIKANRRLARRLNEDYRLHIDESIFCDLGNYKRPADRSCTGIISDYSRDLRQSKSREDILPILESCHLLFIDIKRFGKKSDNWLPKDVFNFFSENGFSVGGEVVNQAGVNFFKFVKKDSAEDVPSSFKKDDKRSPNFEFGSLQPNADALLNFNNYLVTQLGKRYEEMGEKESGLYGFYKTRLKSECFFPPQEIQLVEKILATYGCEKDVFDIGAGIGTTAIMLSTCGVKTYAIEHDRRRYQIMEDVICSKDNLIYERLKPINSKFPSEAISSYIDQNSLGVIVNLVATMSDELYQNIIKALDHFELFIIDVQRFRVSRDEAQQQLLLHDIKRLTGRSPKLFLDSGVNGRFMVFEKSRKKKGFWSSLKQLKKRILARR